MSLPSEILTFDDVTFGYGPAPAVLDITFSVTQGDYVALIGPNGSGKTTLAKLAMGLERPQSGTVRLFGKDVRDFSQWSKIGYVPQRASAFNVRFPATVSDVVAHGEYHGFDPGALFRRRRSPAVVETLHTVGMWDYRDRLISELSGGQQQRVLIGRAIVHHPKLLVLDEPTTGIDKPGQEQFHALLRRLRQERGMTVVLISHDVGMVLQEATKVACIDCRLLSYSAAEQVTANELALVYGHRMGVHSHSHSHGDAAG